MVQWKHALSLCIAGLFVGQAIALTADDYLVKALPGLDTTDLNIRQYAGHIEVSPETNGNLFFWMIEQAHETKPEKLIIWLNGGPGCSSMDGLFLENGPYRVNPDMTLNISHGGWHDYATIVFLDQPVGTGFSFADSLSYMRNMTQIAEEFTVFLDKFLTIFPDLSDSDMYLAGESFAGTYIPYFAARMLELNKQGLTEYNLKGIAIGNGWISPRHQYDAYYDFAVQQNLLKKNYKEYAANKLKFCHEQLDKQELININVCEGVLSAVIDSSVYEKDNVKYCINQYDIRIKNEPEPDCGMTWPHELEDVTSYLRLDDLVKAVHAEKKDVGWRECSSAVSRNLDNDNSKPSYNLLPQILQDIPVLLFSGDQDLICNVLGTEYLIGNLTWNGAKGFGKAERLDWFINDTVVGSVTEARNLSFVIIYGGSHMVPYDKPVETLDMINRFMGVGNDQVNGLPSRVGPEAPATEDDALPPVEASGDQVEPLSPPAAATEEEEGDEWSQYYNWGTWTLIVVILFAGVVGFCWYRSRRDGGYTPASRGAPGKSGGSDGGPVGWILGLLGKTRRGRNPTFRLDDQDDTNELDELVIETPTLFAAEEYSDNEQQSRQGANQNNNSNKKTTRFAIAGEEEEDDDDDFEDFAEWDEDPIINMKGDKIH